METPLRPPPVPRRCPVCRCATDSSLTDPVLMKLNQTLCPSAFKTGLEMVVRGLGWAGGVQEGGRG